MISIRGLGTIFVFCVAFASSEMVSKSQDGARENLRKLTMANNEVAFNLHRKLASNSSSNVFFSPFSISTAFGMLFYGTSGGTAEELRKALGYEKADLPSNLVHVTFNHFLSEVLNTTDFSAGYVLKAANAILVDKRFELFEKYKRDVTELYETAIRDVDFSKNTSDIIEEINSWVKEKTDGKIETFLDDLSPSILMVLLNAVYFKGTWKFQFDPDETTEEIFFNNGLESEKRTYFNMKIVQVFAAFFALYVASTSARGIHTEEEARENFRKLSLANNELAFNLHRRLASGSSDNVFFSPLSISTAFGMLFYGTRGNTAQELREALGYEKADLPNSLVHDTFNRFLRKVLKSEDSSTGYVLNAANAVLVDKHLELLETYRNDVQDLYRAVVRDVDFSREAPRIVEEINDWVREKTNGKIENLLEELSPSTIMVLLNAVYFKGTWKIEFDREETNDRLFYNNGLESERKRWPLMYMREKLPYAKFDSYQALELPYKGGDVSMLILLPNQLDGLRSLEQNLTPEILEEVQGRLQKTEVDVLLPKFKLEYEEELSEEVKALGANEIFSAGSADFSGMTHRRDVFVSQVLHKAVIEVNEEGSEAAAVTGIISNRMGRLDENPEFTADHPFLFAIVEKGSRSNMILFLGRVNNL